MGDAPSDPFGLVGTLIERKYRVESVVAAGGFGVVYAARHLGLDEPVALKVLKPAPGLDDEQRADLLLAFQDEARMLARLRQPNIVAVRDAGTLMADERVVPWMALEWLEGETLRDDLDRRRAAELGGRAPEAALALLRPVFEAIAAAHDAGIAHRDIKPSNVMLVPGPTGPSARVLDFGVAKIMEPERARPGTGATSTAGRPAGFTRASAAPEQLAGGRTGPWTDVHALALLVTEVVTGRPPIDTDDPSEHYRRVFDRARPTPGALGVDVAGWEPVLDRALAVQPTDRHADARALLADLDRASAVPVRPRRSWTSFVAVLALVAGVLALVVTELRRAAPEPATAEAPASASIVTALTRPPPPSAHPDAAAAYVQAKRRVHDADWQGARVDLARALLLDASMPQAHLWLAVMSAVGFSRQSPVVHEHYAAVVREQARLDARDRELLAALEPWLGRDPPDASEAAERLQRLAELRGSDAELYGLAGFVWSVVGVPSASQAANERAVGLDPAAADALQSLGRARMALGDDAGANAAIAACRAAAPLSSECILEQALADAYRGRCEDVVEETRAGLALNPRNAYLRGAQAGALFSAGRPAEAVRAALEQHWASLDEAARPAEQALGEARLAVLAGRFDVALQACARGDALLSDERDAAMHGAFARLAAEAAREAGRPGDAAPLATRYLARREVWTTGSSPRVDPSLVLVATLRRAGLVSAEDVERERRAFLRTWRAAAEVPATWGPLHAALAETREDAVIALSSLPPSASPRQAITHPVEQVSVGRLLLLAGRPDDALPWLEVAARACDALAEPVRQTLANAWLGEAREALGDREGACAAYRVVAARWGKATPRSTTLEQVRERSRRLGCGG